MQGLAPPHRWFHRWCIGPVTRCTLGGAMLSFTWYHQTLRLMITLNRQGKLSRPNMFNFWFSIDKIRYQNSLQERNIICYFISEFGGVVTADPNCCWRQNKVWETLTQGEPARSIPGITARWQTILTLSSEPRQMNGCSVSSLPTEGCSARPDPPLLPNPNTVMSEVQLSTQCRHF